MLLTLSIASTKLNFFQIISLNTNCTPQILIQNWQFSRRSSHIYSLLSKHIKIVWKITQSFPGKRKIFKQKTNKDILTADQWANIITTLSIIWLLFGYVCKWKSRHLDHQAWHATTYANRLVDLFWIKLNVDKEENFLIQKILGFSDALKIKLLTDIVS